jgi:signal peptidase I
MAKSKKSAKSRDAYPKVPGSTSPASPRAQTHAVRETVESIVIAFVLAFLFRTFEAEAFVIPTGSMAPTLMGRHKDVDCPKCGYRYQVSASEEESDNIHRPRANTIAGMCPMCRYVLPMVPNLPQVAPDRRAETDFQRSYNGDRILVNKYIYAFTDPERWDVVVFKFPGDAQINYIKRLVGLPEETLRIYQGDLFVGGEGATRDADFEIARKPAKKVLAMRQLVHDTNYDPAELEAAGWPLRWQSDGWQVEKEIEKNVVRQRYLVDGRNDDAAWLRYQHIVPTYGVWQLLDGTNRQQLTGNPALRAELRSHQLPRLITDANPYNAREDSLRIGAENNLAIDAERQGIHWVGDLMVEADIAIEAAAGQLLLDLVEGGRHFTCSLDLTSGEATLSADGDRDYAPKANTSIDAPGKHRVAFANIDDQLMLWIDGELISFDGGAAYDVNQVFGDRREILPRSGEDDRGDLAPAGVGARGAKLAVTRLRLWRDIYYIADDWRHHPQRVGTNISDYDVPSDVAAMLYRPERWEVFSTRRHVDFALGKDQFFVMGDNSAESADARLWFGDSLRGGRPGGDYLERRLLIGKALCVYWPHSWHRIPGTPIPFPLFPNFADMRLVR